MQLVHQAVGEHGPHERAAAADVEVAAGLVLERADAVGRVEPDDRRVVPVGLLQRARDDVLRGLVEERRAGIVLGGAPPPPPREHPVRAAPEQDARRAARQGADRLPHLGVEAVVGRPPRVLEDAVEADELVYRDLAHAHLLIGALALPTKTRRGRGTHRRPRYSDSSTRSLRSVWYSTCVSCSTVRHSAPSRARMCRRYSGAPGILTLSATTTAPGRSQPRSTMRSRSGR